MDEDADTSAAAEQRTMARASSIEKFAQVIIPALLGGLFGALGQYSIIHGYVSTPLSPESYLGGVLEMLVILGFAIPAIIIHTISQRSGSRAPEGPDPDVAEEEIPTEIGMAEGGMDEGGLYKMEFLGGGMAALLIFSLFGLLFAYCLLPVVVLFWFYASMSWSQHQLPDFRMGFWAGLGCVVGTLSGSIAVAMLLA
jgi:hypothetical protein